MAASNSIRLFVVSSHAPDISLDMPPRRKIAAHPPRPGFGTHAPSVKISTHGRSEGAGAKSKPSCEGLFFRTKNPAPGLAGNRIQSERLAPFESDSQLVRLATGSKSRQIYFPTRRKRKVKPLERLIRWGVTEQIAPTALGAFVAIVPEARRSHIVTVRKETSRMLKTR